MSGSGVERRSESRVAKQNSDARALTPEELVEGGRLPKGWKWARVKEIGDVQLGRQRSPEHHAGRNMRPYLRVANVHEDRLDLSDVKEMNFTPKEFEVFALQPGDILLNEGQSLEWVGRSALYRGEVPGVCFQNTLVRFRTRPIVDPKFALSVFRGYLHTGKFQKIARWTTNIAHLGAGRFAEMPFPLPPMEEQHRIVAEIEKQFTRLEAGVAALRRARANLKRYRAAVLKAACEGRLVPTEAAWSDSQLGRVLENIEAGRSFRCDERPPHTDEIGVAKVSAVTWGTYDEDESKTCTDPSRVEARFLIRSGDFLFSRANTIDLIGACVIAKTVTLRVMLSDKILRFVFSSDVVPEWVMYWLRSELGRNEIKRLSTGNQESMRNIGQDRIRQIGFKLPPLKEQLRIVAEVERRISVVDELDALVTANLQRAARLRQSILQRAFSGGLVPPKASD